MRPERELKQRPWILAVDHDAVTRGLLAEELDDRYGRHYEVVVAASSAEARTYLCDVADVDVAVVLAVVDVVGSVRTGQPVPASNKQ